MQAEKQAASAGLKWPSHVKEARLSRPGIWNLSWKSWFSFEASNLRNKTTETAASRSLRTDSDQCTLLVSECQETEEVWQPISASQQLQDIFFERRLLYFFFFRRKQVHVQSYNFIIESSAISLTGMFSCSPSPNKVVLDGKLNAAWMVKHIK